MTSGSKVFYQVISKPIKNRNRNIRENFDSKVLNQSVKHAFFGTKKQAPHCWKRQLLHWAGVKKLRPKDRIRTPIIPIPICALYPCCVIILITLTPFFINPDTWWMNRDKIIPRFHSIQRKGLHSHWGWVLSSNRL